MPVTGLSAQPLRIPDAHRQDFEILRQGLLRDVRPEGALEQALFERFLLAQWNLRRLARYETELLDETNPFAPASPSDAQIFDRLARYRRDLERSAHRLLTELRQLQTQRAVLLQLPGRVAQTLSSATPLAQLTQITNDTDYFIRKSSSGRAPIFHRSRNAARGNPRFTLSFVSPHKTPEPAA